MIVVFYHVHKIAYPVHKMAYISAQNDVYIKQYIKWYKTVLKDAHTNFVTIMYIKQHTKCNKIA